VYVVSRYFANSLIDFLQIWKFGLWEQSNISVDF